VTLRLTLTFLVALLLAVASTSQASAAHPCAVDAVDRAGKLLRFHFGPDIATMQVGDGTTVTVGKPVRALKGKGKFDVLTVSSNILKASYRMRFIYAQLPGCVLMGQEILEASDPYPELGRSCTTASFNVKMSKAMPVGAPCTAKNDEGDSFEGVVQK
jgi:hypothetical protein